MDKHLNTNQKCVGSTPTEGANMINEEDDIVYLLRKRAEIRRQISTRKSVQEGKPDRIADLLEEAANELEYQQYRYEDLERYIDANRSDLS